MDKRFTSDVESERLSIEEYEKHYGHTVNPNQIWRDGALIPGSPSECSFSTLTQKLDQNGDYLSSMHIFMDGAKPHNLVEKIIKLPLNRVPGTLNCFSNPNFKNVIGREFDSGDDAENSWQYKLYNSDNEELAYGVGDQYVDSASGTLIFKEKSFCESLTKDSKFYVSFYRYAGETGFFGSESGIRLPFRDDLTLLKDAESEERTALFKLHGEYTNTIYILPKPNFDWDEIRGLGYHGRDEALATHGVIMLEENYNDIDWAIGRHDGGLYMNDGTVKRVIN